MNWKLTLKLLPFFFFGLNAATAQVSCEYRLFLEDTFGDGWNGAVLTVTVNGVSTDYTINFNDNNGDFNDFSITLQTGDQVTLSYSPGTFENEVIYTLFDPDGLAVWTDGPFPLTGTDIFEFTAECPSCPVPPTGGVAIDDIRAFYADISWVASDPDGNYFLELGPSGFVLGDGEVSIVQGENARLDNLDENTAYDFYLSVECTNGDTSNVIGPYQFVTPWANDVGIVEVITPLTGCGLGTAETISIAMTNFGGLPQTLIPFNYSVNGVPGGVSMPQDGFFTGVVGVDSTEVIDFETTFDFSEPGVYEIQVWTDLASDSLRMNDTTTLTITNIPIINEFPYYEDFEDWNGGWTVSEESNNATWEYGMPNAPIISSAASGDNAWVTNLSGFYGDSEFSYLESPCLDFTGMTEDPNFGFSMFLSMETFDRFWVEVSGDEGQSWNKLGVSGEGINWYNDTFDDSWDGGAEFANGWTTSVFPMEGFADSSDIRIRFVFDGSFFSDQEGVAIDNIFIGEPFATDLGAVAVDNNAADGCGSPEDEVTMTIINLGQTTQAGFDVAYQVNGGTPVIEPATGVIVLPGTQEQFTFATPFNSAEGTSFEIKAWTVFSDDFAQNDTTSTTVSVAVNALPVIEDFESNEFPADWATDEAFPIYGPGAHNTPTINIGDNIYSGDPSFFVELPFVGPVGDPLFISFDYRYTDWSAGTNPTTLSENDRLEVQLSTNCTDYTTIFTIDQTNHVESAEFQTISLMTSDYVGENVKLRLLATWGSGDYWLDLDNFNLSTCPIDGFSTEVIVTDISADGQSDGAITVIPATGVAPYTYLWADGSMESERIDLPAGDYQVTITDQNGCTEVIDITVDVMVSIGEIEVLEDLILSPNPTTGDATLNITFREAADMQLQVLNTMGQLMSQQMEYGVKTATYPINLSQLPDGLYLVRILVADKVVTRKLIKAQ
jgi:hypothetical protein